MWKGLIVGVLGAVLWFGGLLTPLGKSALFFNSHCPPLSVSPDCGYEPLAPLFFGPPIGVLASALLSWRIDRALARRVEWKRRATVFAFAAATYGGILGACWALSLSVRYAAGFPARLAFLPLALSGLDWAGPLPIILWSLIGGAVHASLWKARRSAIA